MLNNTILEADRTICTHTLGGTYPGIFSGRYETEFSFSHLLLEISMTVIITRFLHYILKPFKQPRITSEILGGLIMGPSVLGRSSKFASFVFPSNSEYVMKTFGIMGFMYFLFICGVKTDLSTVERASRKQWSIALFGVIIPLIATTAVALTYRDDLTEELRKGASIWGVASSLSITAFPVIYTIIKDFNLINSDIGRMALLTSVISDMVGINGVIAFEAAKQGETKPIAALWYMISLVTVVAALLVGMRHVCLWIIRTTPQGKPVDQFYIVAILLGVMVAGFISDFLGLAVANGPLWLGLAIPDGPPLGSTLVDKSETFLLEILMPFSYIYIGLYTDVSSMSGRWPELKPLFYMALCAYVTKLISTIMITRFFFNMTVRDSLTFSLIMSLRGQVELILFIHWVDFKMITQPYFTMMVLLSTTVSAVISPLINTIYDPTRPYAVNKRRNIQHNPPNADFNIVVTIQDEESVPGFINLLEISNPCQNSPLSVSALRLIELVGRATPIFVDHENQDHSLNYTSNNPIHNAFKLHHESRCNFINVHPFTSVSPKRSMYQDICELALLKKASIIILPFDKDNLRSEISIEGAETAQKKSKTMNENVLDHAPCSVGVFVDKGFFKNYNIQSSTTHVELVRHHFAVLFLGGPDSREALAYADRMANHPKVWLTVVRFLAYKGEGDDVMEKKLDDGLVTWFWVKNEGNSRVIYREVVVQNGEETMAAIQGMNDDYYDLWIVGRKHGINPVLFSGLTSWSENDELGVIGEYVASMDLGTTASVLVIQQQVLRGR